MKLSILVPSIPERIANIKFIDHPEIEFLVFTDNKKRSIGLKRQALLDIAKGDYVTWLDDDDDMPDYFIDEALSAMSTQPDVITFDHEAWINGKKYIINSSINNKDEQLHDGIVKRKPYVSCIWRRDVANRGVFPDINYGEDKIWAEQLNPTSEIHIDKIMNKYIYEDKKTSSVEIKRITPKKTCIISYSSKGKQDYNEKIKSLIDSVKNVGFETDFIIYSPDHPLAEYNGVKIHKGLPPNCKPHSEVPYMFKPALFQYARSLGYEQIVWCDSTVQLLRHPEYYLGYAGTNGITVWDNPGHPLHKYFNDSASKYFNVNLKSIQEVKQIMACVIIMDVTVGHTILILNEWFDCARYAFPDDDTVRDGFVAHRHDQAALSYILHLWKFHLLPYGSLAYPPHHESGEYETIFLNK